MSQQSYSNEGVPYWLARTGIDSVSFIKQVAPPLAFLNRGILYELVDGVLYFNGHPVLLQGDPIIVDSVDLVPQAANPGGVNTLWESTGSTPSGHLFHGAHDTENYCPTCVYVSESTPHSSLADGATGHINNPLGTLTEGLTLYDPLGTTFYVEGGYTGEPITVPAQTVWRGTAGVSFRSVLGGLTVAGATWTGPPPFGFNQASFSGFTLGGLVDFQDLAMTTPLLSFNDCVATGGIQTNGNCTGFLLLKNCILASTLAIVNTNVQMVATQFGLLELIPGNVTVSHNAAADMFVQLGNTTGATTGTVAINANSLANVLTVSLIGWNNFSLVNVNSVTVPGGLILIVDDVPNLAFGVGAEANTTIRYTKRALQVGYTPAVPGDWLTPPTQVSDALDELAATGTGDVTGPAGAATNNLASYADITGKLLSASPSVTCIGGALGSVTTINGIAVPAAFGDVVGPGVATDNAIARFDGTTGKLVQNSAVLIDDTTGVMTFAATRMITPIGTTNIGIGPIAINPAASGTNNTAVGRAALIDLTSGVNNTSIGSLSGESITSGGNNTFAGFSAGANITTVSDNTCVGSRAGLAITSSASNTCIGSQSLQTLTSGAGENTCVGFFSGNGITTGTINTLLGSQAGSSITSGASNVCIGWQAGAAYTTESNNIVLFDLGLGGDSGVIRIGTVGQQTSAFVAGVHGVTTGGVAIPVLVDANGQLGTVSSSAKYKENISTIPASESALVHQLRLVNFNYIGSSHPQRGVIAEEVSQVDDRMCIYDDVARTQLRTVDYQQVMILALAEVQRLRKEVDLLNAKMALLTY
jgi:hypothetical protein